MIDSRNFIGVIRGAVQAYFLGYVLAELHRGHAPKINLSPFPPVSMKDVK